MIDNIDKVVERHETEGFEAYGIEPPPAVMDDIDEDQPDRKYLLADRTMVSGITVDAPDGGQFPAVLLSMKSPLLPFGIYDGMTLDDARSLHESLGEAIEHMEAVIADMAKKGEATWPPAKKPVN